MSPFSVAVAWRLRSDWHAETLLRRSARHVAATEKFRTGQLSIVVVGARAMATLHQRFLNLPGPTDVLTFDLGSDRTHGWLDAEIILCADIARRNAGPRATLAACRAELALYLVHGLLHLAGHDDHAPPQSTRMHAREDQLLKQLGLGPVYATGRHR